MRVEWQVLSIVEQRQEQVARS
ncbi:protein of unknown function [Alcaligenes faecalis subsp. faecalis]|nr:protein of unknown function [Alcaligenes faecalis subsp. faecalis]